MTNEKEVPVEPPTAVLDAEMSVIGGMFLEPAMIPAVMGIIGDEDFLADRHARLFRAIAALHADGGVIDSVTLPAKLSDTGEFGHAGGHPYLARILDAVPTAANIEYHARLVARHAARRRIRAAAEAIRDLAGDATLGPEELRAEAERLFADTRPLRDSGGLVRAADLLPEFMEHLEAITRKDASALGVRTGLRAVDDKLGPMDRGALVIVAGRPSMGKTAFAVGNIVPDALFRQQKRVAVFSVETTPNGLLTRIAGAEASANVARARKRAGFEGDEYGRLVSLVTDLKRYPLAIGHTPGLTVEQMRLQLRKAVHEVGPLDLVVVDYLQLMSQPKAKSRYEEVSAIGTGLKRIASEFDCVVVALSQLSRKVEERPDRRPMMSDLRESGTLEQDADAILLLYRPEYYFGAEMTVGRGKDAKKVDVQGKAEVILGKVRDGETGAALVAWEGEYTRFRDLSTREEFGR